MEDPPPSFPFFLFLALEVVGSSCGSCGTIDVALEDQRGGLLTTVDFVHTSEHQEQGPVVFQLV